MLQSDSFFHQLCGFILRPILFIPFVLVYFRPPRCSQLQIFLCSQCCQCGNYRVTDLNYFRTKGKLAIILVVWYNFKLVESTQIINQRFLLFIKLLVNHYCTEFIYFLQKTFTRFCKYQVRISYKCQGHCKVHRVVHDKLSSFCVYCLKTSAINIYFCS